jgi:transcriptional regulator with XRE-family HTH domain
MSHGKDDREARILRERRASLGLTQDQVATEAGIEMRAYQRYEHGKVRLSSATMR